MKSDKIYLQHILDAINRILDYTSEGKTKFLEDPKTQDAVVRNFEIIGEAAKKLSEKIKSDVPDLPWKKIAGMRDKLIHEYFGINLELVWEVVESDLPRLNAIIKIMID